MGGETLRVYQKGNAEVANKPASRTSLFFRKMWKPVLKSAFIITFWITLPLVATNTASSQEKIPKYLKDLKHLTTKYQPKSPEDKPTVPKTQEKTPKFTLKKLVMKNGKIVVVDEGKTQNKIKAEDKPVVPKITVKAPEQKKQNSTTKKNTQQNQNNYQKNKQQKQNYQYSQQNNRSSDKETRKTVKREDAFGVTYEVGLDDDGRPNLPAMIGIMVLSILEGLAVAGAVIGFFALMGKMLGSDSKPEPYNPQDPGYMASSRADKEKLNQMGGDPRG